MSRPVPLVNGAVLRLFTLTALLVSTLIITGCNENKEQLDPTVYKIDFTSPSPQTAGKFQFSRLKLTDTDSGVFLEAFVSTGHRVEKFELTVGGQKRTAYASSDRFSSDLFGISADQAKEVGIRHLGESRSDGALKVYKAALWLWLVSPLILGLFGLIRRWNKSAWERYVRAILLGPIVGGIIGFAVGGVFGIILGTLFIGRVSDPAAAGALGMVLSIGGVVFGPIFGPWVVFAFLSGSKTNAPIKLGHERKRD